MHGGVVDIVTWFDLHPFLTAGMFLGGWYGAVMLLDYLTGSKGFHLP